MSAQEKPPVVLITGASTGVGAAAAVSFAKAGYRTIATLRNPDRAGELRDLAGTAGVTLEIERLDVEDRASIDERAAAALAQGGVDVLVNNAGAGFLGSLEQTTDEDLDRVMNANFFGAWRLTRALLPHMRERGSGRIISLSSVGGLVGQPFNDAYCAAKFALEGAMESLAPVARAFGVHVSLVEPGPINTAFVANVRATSQEVLGRLVPPYDQLAAAYMGASGNVFATYGQTGDDIAEIILKIAQDPAPKLRNITSDFAAGFVGCKLKDMTGEATLAVTGARLKAG
ncbi:SDR family oxidoreductase [Phenylobacterium montanum]|uniref:SDR family oxidoreductase n=1 Tax=Phenylobacterium montanum TaxID=2823693 RepID=A0A975G0E4_9CAUL|nr:SDR family oxidoreductase [Caulobacter sp. S6]QUD88252.1 SDR family oxidoreductase [Caulobacter sp. S6]